jgi:hypothetical protein
MMIADLAVVTARLPYVDRGTLSRAWYDALHLAHEATGPVASPVGGAMQAAKRLPLSVQNTQGVVGKNSASSQQILKAQNRGLRAVGERSRIHSPFITKKRCGQIAVPLSTSLAQHPMQQTAVVHLPGGERICLILRSEKHGIRVIALCAEHLRPRVSLALSAVQRMLASEGLTCHLSVGGEVS